MTAPAHEIRPWGEFWVLESAAGHKVKRIEIAAGKRLSYQRHRRRSEHWFFVAGRARIVLDDVEHVREPRETFDVPRGAWHRVESLGPGPLVFIEIQTGDYFGEDDIERRADDFGRA